MRELLPGINRLGVLINPGDASRAEFVASEVQAAARSMGQEIYILKADTSDQIDEAFAAFERERVDALFVGPDPFFNSRRLQFALMAVRHMIPAIYGAREYVEAGGLMSYGANLVDMFREVGVYTGKILKGVKPEDLPVVQSSKFELLINRQDREGARPRSAADAARPRRRGDRMKRREFITLLGGAAAWPIAARAQQPMPVVGFLGSGTPTTQGLSSSAFAQRLRELGWIEGRTFAIEYRWTDGRSERYAEFAAEFVRLKVNVIFTTGTPAAIAAKRATTLIPIVFAGAANPVGGGLVASLTQPGGNLTGLSSQNAEVASKRLELLREAIPSPPPIGGPRQYRQFRRCAGTG